MKKIACLNQVEKIPVLEKIVIIAITLEASSLKTFNNKFSSKI